MVSDSRKRPIFHVRNSKANVPIPNPETPCSRTNHKTSSLPKAGSERREEKTIAVFLSLITPIIKLPLPPNPPNQPIRNIARKTPHTTTLSKIARRVNTAAIVPARGAVEVADVVRQTRHDAALGVGFLQHLREAVAGFGAVGAFEDHLVDCGGRAGGEGGWGGDVGRGGGGGAEGGEHGGGLVAGLGAVGAGGWWLVCCCSSWTGEVAGVPLHQPGGEEVGVRGRGPHAAIGGLHDSRKDEAAIDASGVGDVDNRFVDRRSLVRGVAGDFPGVAGFFDGLLVGSEPREL